MCLALLLLLFQSSEAKTDNVNYPLSQYVYKQKLLKANVPFSEQVKSANTKYIIKWNHVLDKDITIPENCILEFDGGTILGSHTLTFKNTLIKSDINIG